MGTLCGSTGVGGLLSRAELAAPGTCEGTQHPPWLQSHLGPSARHLLMKLGFSVVRLQWGWDGGGGLCSLGLPESRRRV